MKMSKVCTKCKVEKPLDEFYRNKKQKDGRRARCKECYYAPEQEAARNLKARYGITLAEYDTMLEQQGGCCKVCGTADSGGKGRFHVDHNHTTGKVRGLLCNGCNIGIGHLKDSPDVLLKAAAYLLEQGYYGD